MSETIEIVARALEPKCRAFGHGEMPMNVAREFARAAIEAIREPTQSQLNEVYKRISGCGNARDMWTIMIDEALR